MVLETLGVGGFDLRELEELCCTKSIWTVDLAYLLHKFSVNFSFFTVTLGANPSYAAENYYKEQLQNDVCRVDRLFNKAFESAIRIQCRSIGGEEISALIVSGQYIAVALVDKIKLSPSWLKDVCVPGYHFESSDYMGHYVVICGYDADTDEFEIRDPASCRMNERISLKCLDEARKSFGTDEDILLGRKQLKRIESIFAIEKIVKNVLTILGLVPSSYNEVLQQLREKALKRAGRTEDQVLEKIEERNTQRKNKEFEKSDDIRKELAAVGIALMDSSQGTTWRPGIPLDLQEKIAST